MGNTPSTSENTNIIKFGSINDPQNSRPGYYSNGKIIKYHTDVIDLIPGETINSFTKLKYGYAVTNKRVFYKGVPIKNASPDNFKIINRENVKDPELSKLNSVLGIENDKKIYHKGKLINAVYKTNIIR